MRNSEVLREQNKLLNEIDQLVLKKRVILKISKSKRIKGDI